MEQVGHQVRAVGRKHGQGQLDEMVISSPEQAGDQEAGDGADGHAADEADRELDDVLAKGRRISPEPGEGHDEDEGGRPVIEQALGIHERHEPGRGRQSPHRADDRDRVRRGHDRAHYEGLVQGQPGREVQHERDDRGRDQDARDREQSDTPERPAQLVAIQAIGGLEDEAGQQQRDSELGRDPEVLMDRQGGDRQTDHDQHDGVGQPQATRDEHDQRHGDQERHEQDEIGRWGPGHGGHPRRPGRRRDGPAGAPGPRGRSGDKTARQGRRLPRSSSDGACSRRSTGGIRGA